MNDTDDLIKQLQDRLSARAQNVDAPPGLADQARRSAHRRVARRTAAGAVSSLLAAALVVTLVTTGQSSHPGSGVDAAFIAKHVSAQLGEQSARPAVIYSVTTTPAGMTDGGQRTESWEYSDPHSDLQTSYSRTTDAHGRVINLSRDSLRIDHRHAHDTTLILNPIRRTWSRGSDSYTIPRDPGPGFFANDRQLRQQIARRQFTRVGTATIAGQQALKLRLQLTAKFKKVEAVVLYVNATTYRPLKKTTTVHEGDERFTEDMYWQAVTPANQARATRSLPVPSGYKKVVSPAVAADRSNEKNIRIKLRHTTSPHERRLLHRDLRQLQHGS